jgi:acetamidase/formamidase
MQDRSNRVSGNLASRWCVVAIRYLAPIALACLAWTLPTGALADVEAEVSGNWQLSWFRFGDTNVTRVHLEASGGKVTGKGFRDAELQGHLSDTTLNLDVLNNEKKVVGTLNCKVQEGGFSGTLTLHGREYPCSAARPPVGNPQEPKVHDFEPTEFHNYFSGTIPPVLRISPGDTVRTETVDAGGYDKKGVQRARGGNPLTGPFYIEGALRGDTLAVRFKRIRLNRDTAESGSSIMGSALEPGYVADQKPVADFDSSWRLDRERGVGVLAKPTDKLREFTVPLQPMLGCVGVAPPRRQSILSGDLGSYGGNMDYNQIREGTTLYLPVFETGALLFLGDGHAAEGDGELTGDALETSMDVEFTVDLIPEKGIGGPRAENDEYLMALGIGNSLPDALQHATTELANWLAEDYKLNPSEAAIVLGFAMRYDIAEVVDPHVNLVAKVKKSALSRIKK